MPYEVLYGFFFTSVLLTLSPGPDVLYVISQSVTHGTRSGLAIIFGLLTGLVVHLSLFAFGVSSLIINSELAFGGIKIFGGSYLLWLAYQIFKQPVEISPIAISNSSKEKASFLGFMQKGFWMNVLNPKVMMFFLALFPSFLSINSSWSIKDQVLVLGVIFILQAFVIFFVICNVAGYFSKFILQSVLFNKIIKWLQVVIFSLLGVFLWYSLF
ncbi:LysE family translocator [Myroides sp. LJL119]